MNKAIISGLVVVFMLSLSLPYAMAISCGAGKETSQKKALQDNGEVVNAICPVMGGKVEKDTAYKVEYNGKAIGFCCQACIDKFNEDPEGYLEELKEEIQETE